MADNQAVDNGALPDYTVVADEITSPYGGGTALAEGVKLLDGTPNSPTPIPGGALGLAVNPAQMVPSLGSLGSRSLRTSRLIDLEDFRNPTPGMWNDGVGGATRDTEISLGSMPCFRLDTQGVTATPQNPTTTALQAVSAVVGGGTFAANTYFWYVAGITPVGEGARGTERSQAIAAGGHAVLIWTDIDGYSGYRIYRGTSSGAETLVATVGKVSTYTDTGTAADGVTSPLTTSTAINPSRTAITTGVVAKRRIHDGFLGTFGVETWFRFTSTNNTSNVLPVLSVYNRDGASAWHGRLWLKVQGNNLPIDACILDGAASAAANADALNGAGAIWRKVDESRLQNGGGTHLYEPGAGRMDRAGGWHWCRLVVDFATKTYVSVQIDGNAAIDLTAYVLDQTTTSGFAGWHSSFEYAGLTSSARYMHLSRFAITEEVGR